MRLRTILAVGALTTLVVGGCESERAGKRGGTGEAGTTGGGTGGVGGTSGSSTAGASGTGGGVVGGAGAGGRGVGGSATGGTDDGMDTGGTGGNGTGEGGAGETGEGGTPAGSGGAGGVAGVGVVSGAGGAGGTGIRIVDIVGSLDGRLIQYPCSAQTTSDTCPVANYWVGGVMGPCRFGEMVLTHTIGGTPGATYLVTMHFYGIMEPKNFGANVQRDGGTTRPENLDSGARPSPWAVPQGSFDSTATSFSSYEIHVFRTYNQEVGVYFLNSDTEESNTTYVIDYEKTIPVIGGGFVELRRGDTDCVQQKNCGATSGFPCASRARSVDVSAVSPQPPPPATASQGGFWQPGLGFPTDDAGQWWLIDVTAVTPM